MGIFFLFIPLALFIAAEGVILYFLTDMVMSALFTNNFSVTTVVDNVYPASLAILYVALLMLAIGVAIYLYIRFIIGSAIQYKKQKKAGHYNPAAAEANGHYNTYNLYNLNVPGSAANRTASKNNFKVTAANAPVKKRKSKKPLIIFCVIFVLIIGAAAYLFIAHPKWLPFDLPRLPFL